MFILSSLSAYEAISMPCLLELMLLLLLLVGLKVQPTFRYMQPQRDRGSDPPNNIIIVAVVVVVSRA